MHRVAILAALLLLSTPPTGFSAEVEMVVDQQNPVNVLQGAFGANLDNGLGPLGQIAQVFTPTQSSLGVFTFFLQDRNVGNGIGLSVFIEIATADLTQVIAESSLVTLPDSFGAPTASLGNAQEAFFLFDDPVALSPGVQYAARLRKVSGDLFVVVGGRNAGYPDGYYIPTHNSTEDLFFREGHTVPEPSSVILFLGILALPIFRWARRRAIWNACAGRSKARSR
jgi:hypothetical protein